MKKRRKWLIEKAYQIKEDNFLIVYADDFVAGFQYKWEAENYYKLLKERMEKFGIRDIRLLGIHILLRTFTQRHAVHNAKDKF